MSFHKTNPLAMGLQKCRKILSPFPQQHCGRFDRNRQRVIDDIGPVGDSFESSFFRPEAIGPREQRRTYFSANQELESLLIAIWQFQYEIFPNAQLRALSKSLRYRRQSGRAFSTYNRL